MRKDVCEIVLSDGVGGVRPHSGRLLRMVNFTPTIC